MGIPDKKKHLFLLIPKRNSGFRTNILDYGLKLRISEKKNSEISRTSSNSDKQNRNCEKKKLFLLKFNKKLNNIVNMNYI